MGRWSLVYMPKHCGCYSAAVCWNSLIVMEAMLGSLMVGIWLKYPTIKGARTYNSIVQHLLQLLVFFFFPLRQSFSGRCWSFFNALFVGGSQQSYSFGKMLYWIVWNATERPQKQATNNPTIVYKATHFGNVLMSIKAYKYDFVWPNYRLQCRSCVREPIE